MLENLLMRCVTATKNLLRIKRKSFKQGRIVIILSGPRAGCKAIIVQCFDQGTQDKRYAHALVVGIKGRRAANRKPQIFFKTISYKYLQATNLIASDIWMEQLSPEELKIAACCKIQRLSVRQQLLKLYRDGAFSWFFGKLPRPLPVQMYHCTVYSSVLTTVQTTTTTTTFMGYK